MKLDLTYPRSINSKIVSEASAINRILARKINKYHLAYRATEHAFSISEFYKQIAITSKQLRDNQLKHKKTTTTTLILVKTEFGRVLGGCTPLEWQYTNNSTLDSEDEDNPEKERTHSSKHKLKCDPTATTVMFSLDLMEKYCLGKPAEAIYCGAKSIGFGRGDLKIVDRGEQVRRSYCRFPVSYNRVDKPYVGWSKSGMELSGGRYSVCFKLVEW